MTAPLPTTKSESTTEYGRTISDILTMLDKTDKVLIGVRMGHGYAAVLYLQITKRDTRDALAQYAPDQWLPSEWNSVRRELCIGSGAAIDHALAEGKR